MTFRANPLRRLIPLPAVRLAFDLVTLSLAFAIAFLIRFDGEPTPAMTAVWMAMWPFVVLLHYAVLALLRVPRFCWSAVGLRDIVPIVQGVVIAAAVLLLVRYVAGAFADQLPTLKLVMIPASVVVLNGVLALLGMVGIRALRRLSCEWRQRRRRQSPNKSVSAIVIGAGQGGRMLAKELVARPELGVTVAAFVDDNRLLVGRLVSGIPVRGTTADLPALARELGVDMALIAIASAAPGALHRIVQRCEAAGLKRKIIPPLHEIVSGRCRISQLRDVAIEDLLGRESVEIEDSEAHVAVRGKVAMVTGAGGSIGSELCRQIATLGPRVLVLVERTEHTLYQIHRELQGLLRDVRVIAELADVRDAARMDRIFSEHEPDVVFHAAAHKHVPMLEHQPGEAILNNVFGTKCVADCADRHRIERFILISTDKAVNPTSVMGATKRVAELYVQSLNAQSPVRFAAVRFGNVLGSAGSVIPLFQEQLARGGPLTVTHPDMERFFMTIPEASRLVLEAAGLCVGGEIMMLDMGKPVKIRALAEQMIRLSGLEPGIDIEIRYTGVRGGEKLREELHHTTELVELTKCPKIRVLRSPPPAVRMDDVIAALANPGATAEEIRATLTGVLPNCQLLRTAS